MSTLRETASQVKELGVKELRVLKVLATLIRKYNLVPLEILRTKSRMDDRELEYILRKLHRMKFIKKGELGIRILSSGLDALALRILVKRGMLESLGPPIAIGKESDVYEGLSPEGRTLALKFFRIGRISFRGIKRKREYVKHDVHEWHLVNILSAKKEYRVLKELYGKGCPVPEPLDVVYHVLVMKEYMAVPLYKIRELRDPEKTLRKVLRAVKKCVIEGGYVNGDLSEFNVLLDEREKVLIIDWPQAVRVNTPSYKDRLKRDFINIANYFRRKFGVEVEGFLKEVYMML